MATNKELEKGQKLLKDQITEVGYLDNAFKTLGATITSAIEDSIDALNGMDDITKKIAKSYDRDIVGSIKKSTQGLESQIGIQVKINAGKNVAKEIEDKIDINTARRLLVLEKINSLEGIAPEDKKKLEEKAIDVFNAEKKSLEVLKQSNIAAQKNKGLFTLISESAQTLADEIDKSGTLSKILSGNFQDVFSFTRLAEGAVILLYKAVLAADKAMGAMAKGMNITYAEAGKLQTKMSEVADASNSAKVTSVGLSEALMVVNSELGITNTTVDKNLVFFQQMHKYAGLTYEELKGVNAITNATGGDLKLNTGEILAQATLQGTRLGVALNEKEVLKDISKVSAATTLSLGMSANELGKAVSVAKSLGLELSKVDSIASSLLDFESSIEAELEAELLLGKDINLEKARTAALNNDLATVAEEIAKQAGSAADFGKMNRIEQEALAKAVGMGREELAQTLFTQEQLKGLAGEELALREKQINNLQAKGLSQDAIKAKLAKQSTNELKEQVSVQENLSATVSKLQDAFSKLAGPVLEVVSPIVDLLIPAIAGISILLTPVMEMFTGIAGILTGSFKSLSGIEQVLGVIGTLGLVWFGIVKSIALYEGIINTIKIAQVALQNSMIGGIMTTIGGLVLQLGVQLGLMSAAMATNAALTFGVGVAVAVAAAAAGYFAIKALSGDDIMSPGESGGGYGNRTLMGPEGAIALNNKDTVIAGTNLFPKGDDVMSAGAGEIQMPAPADNSRIEGLLESMVRDQRARPVISNPGVIQIQ